MYKLSADFPMQTLRKKSSPCKYKHEPSRFLGDGVSFRAKLIGVLEVSEARGDRMCQDALADLKMAVRAAGEHKQRIVIHVAIDGLRLRDDKTGDSLYHHPVHKISFIAQDMTDSRAFGYIFGSPDTGHRFFGIKTDKAASQVVIAMRDLFQVVFELKKKEIELAKQQLEGKSSSGSSGRHSSGLSTEFIKQKAVLPETSEASANAGVAELVDLEQELSSLRRGLSQVERLTPAPADPFGDSFTPPPSAGGVGTQFPLQKGLLPPPPTASLVRGRPQRGPTPPADPHATTPVGGPSPVPSLSLQTNTQTEKTAMVESALTAQPSTSQQSTAIPFDVFTELDPLGTGKIKPYVDKKHFFQELKNPPKKVLKDLVPTTSTNLLPEKQAKNEVKSDPTVSGRYQTSQSINVTGSSHYSSSVFTSDPFADNDPFDRDPFVDSYKEDPFNSSVFNFDTRKFSRDSSTDIRSDDSVRAEMRAYNGLQVNLPPDPKGRVDSVELQSIEVPPPPLPPKRESGPPPPRPHPRDNADSADEYVTPRPPPLPGGKRKVKLDITLSALASCGMSELAAKLDVPASMLANMTLPQLTAYLKSYVDNTTENGKEEEKTIEKPPEKPPDPELKVSPNPIFKAKFEDNFASSEKEDVFVADFDNFNKKAAPSYDRYAAFREIQEEERKHTTDDVKSEKSRQNGDGEDSDFDKDEINIIENNKDDKTSKSISSKSPMQVLDELAFESFNLLKSESVSPKNAPIESKIADIKIVMKNIQIKDHNQPSTSPGEQMMKKSDNDKYAALREISFVEPQQEEFESLPSDQPKERKKSDENTDNFDNSDFFDCVDNSSLSFSNVDDPFRKSPLINREVNDKDTKIMPKIDEKELSISPCTPSHALNQARLSTGSLSDIVSGSSPEGGPKGSRSGAWSPLAATSSDEPVQPRMRRRPQTSSHSNYRTKQTSSSSRDVSPWEEEVVRPHRSHMRSSGSSHHRESRHNSSGSRECAESSGHERRSGRERSRPHREPINFRESYEERDHWDRPRQRSPRDRRDPREVRREGSGRRRQHLSWGDDDDFSDGPHSGASGDRDYPDRWESRSRRKDERNYNSLNWRESRRRMETSSRQVEDDRRYGYSSRPRRRRTPSPRRRQGGRVPSSEIRTERLPHSDSRTERLPHSDSRTERLPHSDSRTERLPHSDSRTERLPHSDSRTERALHSDSRSERIPHSEWVDHSDRLPQNESRMSHMDDRFPQPEPRTERLLLTENRGRRTWNREDSPSDNTHQDLHKSESVDIFARKVADPFAEDDFFACTGSDRAARRDNWPGHFRAFDEG